MVAAKTVTAAPAAQVLDELVAEGGDPAAIVEREGLGAIVGRGELEAIVERGDRRQPRRRREDPGGGNAKAIGAIVGAVMQETKGRADGGEVTRLIREQAGL